MSSVDQLRVAILATDGFEQSELQEPKRALDEAGCTTVVVSPRGGTIRGWSDGDWGEEVRVDQVLGEADAGQFDALLLPGGTLNPDTLRQDERAVDFVRQFDAASKPIAAICHGPQLLIQAEAVAGRRLTSYAAIRVDLENAGAEWVDESVVVDGNLVTSRNPNDIPAFNKEVKRHFMQERPTAADSRKRHGTEARP
ncbi:MAG: type 1 glutamine amidotransferase [Bdellovibrionales bacterium]|nr:type 1 glutamine amidotransferase [Bdellovibrionales bacterium]